MLVVFEFLLDDVGRQDAYPVLLGQLGADAEHAFHKARIASQLVVLLVARGRNRRFISEEPMLSEETVKSHVYGMYRKLGIHSQQELLDLVEVHALGVEEQPQKAVFE